MFRCFLSERIRRFPREVPSSPGIMMDYAELAAQTSVQLPLSSCTNLSWQVRIGCRLAFLEAVPRCSKRQSSMEHLQGIVVDGVFAFMTAYFGSIPNNILQPFKHRLSYVTYNICVALSCTYVFSQGVPPMLDKASKIAEAVVEP